jgi:hypothetical protein
LILEDSLFENTQRRKKKKNEEKGIKLMGTLGQD